MACAAVAAACVASWAVSSATLVSALSLLSS